MSETQLVAATPPASPWQTAWYGYDGHGSVRYLTDATGAVTDTYTYDAFGNLINSTGSTANNYLFAGEQYDPDLGLYYNRARYLDVRVGRFWGMDTDEGSPNAPASLHKYLYASANPTNNVDPSGNDDFDMASLGVSESMSETLDTMPSSGEHLLATKAYPVVVVSASMSVSIPRSQVKDYQAPVVGLAEGTPIRIPVPQRR